MQVRAVAGEDLVGHLVHLDVQVARLATARADLALVGEAHPHAVRDPGRDPHADVAPRAHPAVATALSAGLGDDLPEAAAVRARPAGDHLAEEGALHALHLAAAAADVAAGRVAAGRRAGAPHSVHRTAVSTARSRVTPDAHSSSVSCMRISASAPR